MPVVPQLLPELRRVASRFRPFRLTGWVSIERQ